MVDPSYARLQVYTDDPCTVLRGSERSVKRYIAIMALFWMALGWKLSFHKGRWGPEVDWIGFRFRVLRDEVEVSIKESSMEELSRDVYRLTRPRMDLAGC